MPAQLQISFSRSFSQRNTTSLTLVDGCYGADLLLRIIAIFLPVPQPVHASPEAGTQPSGSQPVQPTQSATEAGQPSLTRHAEAVSSESPHVAPTAATSAADPSLPSSLQQPGPQDSAAQPDGSPTDVGLQQHRPPAKSARFSLSIVRCRIACHDWRVPAASRWPDAQALSLDLPHLLLQLPVQEPLQHPAQHAVQSMPSTGQQAGATMDAPQMAQLAAGVRAAFASR